MSFLKKAFPWLLGLMVLVLDYYTKAWTHQNLPRMSESAPFYPYGGLAVFKDFFGIEFSISHAINKGAAWGLGSGYQIYLLWIRIALIGGLFIWLISFNKNKLYYLPMAFILAGALGNILDYFIYGHVVDMFHFVLWGYDFPVFNVADSAIFVGIVWLIWLSSL